VLETFSLIIPYYKLVIFKPANSFTFHMDQHYISIDAPPKNKSVNSFMEKIIQFKAKNSSAFIDDLY